MRRNSEIWLTEEYFYATDEVESICLKFLSVSGLSLVIYVIFSKTSRAKEPVGNRLSVVHRLFCLPCLELLPLLLQSTASHSLLRWPNNVY